MVAFKLNRARPATTQPGSARARSPRRRVVLTGTFHSLTNSHQVAIRNLSCTGASITCSAGLKIGGEGVLQATGLDALCHVVWHKGEVYGVKFDQPLPNPVVLELHRVTEADVQHARSIETREWYEAQAR